MTHSSLDFSQTAEFDALAQSIAARLNCRMSLISVAQKNQLVVLGHSGTFERHASEPGSVERLLPVCDLLCGQVIRLGQPVRCKNVREDAFLRNLPLVAGMKIGAYLGVPVRLEDDGVVAAICALSAEPRIWQDAEETYLLAVADLVASRIECHQLRHEQSALNAALAENDAILTTLAETRGKALTVHNEAGELLFANASLRADFKLNYQELLTLPKAVQNLVAQGVFTGAVEVDLPGRLHRILNVDVGRAKAGLTLAEWQLTPPD